jgi:hypothetical protein
VVVLARVRGCRGAGRGGGGDRGEEEKNRRGGRRGSWSRSVGVGVDSDVKAGLALIRIFLSRPAC